MIIFMHVYMYVCMYMYVYVCVCVLFPINRILWSTLLSSSYDLSIPSWSCMDSWLTHTR